MSEQDGNTAVEKESASADAPQPANTPQGAVDNEPYPEADWERAQPAPATVAALEFQVASLLNDEYAEINWPGRDPIVVNKPGDLAKKLEALRRIAKSQFRSRGDREDVLNAILDDYGLWRWANPVGFWTAFGRDMIDAKKAAREAKCVPLERAATDSSDWVQSPDAKELDRDHRRKWVIEQSGELHLCEPPALDKWKVAQASDNANDLLICEALRRVLADDEYMDELAHAKRDAAKLARFVAEIRSVAGCSQAEAYRLLARFQKRHTKERR